MKYYELNIYLKSKKTIFCKCVFENKLQLNKFIDDLKKIDNKIIEIGGIIFNKEEFKYARIKEKEIK